jgi:hypothetical protein
VTDGGDASGTDVAEGGVQRWPSGGATRRPTVETVGGRRGFSSGAVDRVATGPTPATILA